MEYSHTQRGPLGHILVATAAVLLVIAWLSGQTAPTIITSVVAVLLMLAALTFGSLTVRDEGQWLALRYGPLPVFRKRVPYGQITSVEPGRTSIIDGWGIHWIPGRGYTYNLWGFSCVKLAVGDRTIRVGSDEPDKLVEFLKSKLTATA